jgi:hypothetical protein
MPLAELVTAKLKEIQVHDALCKTNTDTRLRLERELAPVQKELEKQEGFLELCETNLKKSIAEVAKFKAALKAAKTPADITKFTKLLKDEEAKLKGLQAQEPKLKKEVAALQAEAKTNSDAWQKVAGEVKALGVRKTALAAELAVLQGKQKEAAKIDALTYDDVIADHALLKQMGELTHNQEICAFIINGPHGDKSTFLKFVKNDDINLDGAKPVRKKFVDLEQQDLAAQKDKTKPKVDWTKAPWQEAYNAVIRLLHSDTRHLDALKAALKKAKGVN